MWLQTKRTFKFAINNLKHNIGLAFATVGSIAIALFIINIQIANIAANDLLLKDVQDKVNISLYLQPDVSEEDGHKIEETIKQYPEVEKVKYTSKEDSFAKFKKDTENNQVLKEAIEEVEDNPLGITLNIKAYNTSQYAEINNKIRNADFNDKIESVNYEEYKGVIDGLNSEIKSSQKIAMILGITLSVIALLITFSTITITIYTHKKEIEIMKLVGGSNSYVTAPFIWEGMLYGITAAIISIIASYSYLHYIIINSSTGTFLSLSNAKFIKQFLEIYFMNNLWLIILGQLMAGILLGVISALISVRKYLKV